MNIRTIRKQMLGNEGLHAAEMASGLPMTLIAIGLLFAADREGRLEDRPGQVLSSVLPLYAPRLDADRAFDLLEKIGFIQRYVVEGRRLARIVKWTTYQILVQQEPPSELPAPDGSDTATSLVFERPMIRAGQLSEDEAKILALPFAVKSGPAWAVPVESFIRWRELYPRLNVVVELRKARVWLLDNPSKRKTSNGMKAFIGNWLSRANDRLPPVSASEVSAARGWY